MAGFPFERERWETNDMGRVLVRATPEQDYEGEIPIASYSEKASNSPQNDAIARSETQGTQSRRRVSTNQSMLATK